MLRDDAESRLTSKVIGAPERQYDTQQPRVISDDCKPKHATNRQEQKRHEYDETLRHSPLGITRRRSSGVQRKREIRCQEHRTCDAHPLVCSPQMIESIQFTPSELEPLPAA